MEKQQILLLHGALGSKKQFTPLIKMLDKNFDVHSLDFSGHGEKEITTSFSMSLFMENVKSYVKEKGLDKISIFGYSMGGYVALKLAASGETFIHRIYTLGTKFDWSETSTAMEVRKLNPEKIAEKVPHFANSLEQEHGKNWKEVVRQTAKMMQRLSEKEHLTAADLKKVATPVKVLLGDNDEMVSKEETLWAVEHLANATFIQLENCAHPLHKVPIDQVANIIQSHSN